jgi:hypothetical protein
MFNAIPAPARRILAAKANNTGLRAFSDRIPGIRAVSCDVVIGTFAALTDAPSDTRRVAHL